LRFEFELSAFLPDQLPRASLPEVVLVGRSNVGKSSLINALCGGPVAKVSSKPGKTGSLNFYRHLGSPPFRLVDTPGYGYAARSRGELVRWRELVHFYFGSDRPIALVLHVVDARHGFVEGDLSLVEWLSPWRHRRVVVFTKADKLSRSEMSERRRSLGIGFGHLMGGGAFWVSSVKGEGVEELWGFLIGEIKAFRSDGLAPFRGWGGMRSGEKGLS